MGVAVTRRSVEVDETFHEVAVGGVGEVEFDRFALKIA